MKNLFILLIGLAMLASCTKLATVNINPNEPNETHPQYLLTKAEWDAFRSYHGGAPLYAIKMIIQTDGENANQYYKWSRSDFDAYGKLRDVTKMMEEAARINDAGYSALGKFFRAFYFYNLTLTFGDIPYKDALKGESETLYGPQYDDQKSVFAGILSELKEADKILQDYSGNIAGDIIYGGDPLAWRKLINAFRLKVLITLSVKTSEMSNIPAEFAAIYQQGVLMEDVTQSAELKFLDQQDNRYPDFNNSSFGSGLYMDSTFIKRLQDRKDPRLFIYCSQLITAKEQGKPIDDFSSYMGGDPAAPYDQSNGRGLSKPNERYYADPVGEPYILLGYTEQQLILAEAAVRGWINADISALYNSAVKASFSFYEQHGKQYAVYLSPEIADEYLSRDINNMSKASSKEDKIELIIMQKYLQSYYQNGWTAFYDHLRTGYPSFRRPPGVEVPFRWIYPQSEYNDNTKNVSDAITKQFGEGNDQINEKTWWLK